MLEIQNTNTMHNDRVKALIYGASGTGKTYLASTLPHEEVLIISAESGLLTLSDYKIDAVEVKSIEQLGKVLIELKKGSKYKTLFIDSLTEIAEIKRGELDVDEYWGQDKMVLGSWNEYLKSMTKIIKAFRDLTEYNVIFTCLTEQVNDGGIIMQMPLVQGGKLQAKLQSMFDLVMFYNINDNNDRVLHTKPTSRFIAKDRTDKLARDIINPSLTEIFTTIKG